MALVMTVSAQTADVNNPGSLQFTASTDHATIDSYEMDVLKADGITVQLGPVNIGKPLPATTTNLITTPINVMSVPFGAGYTVRVRAKAATAFSLYAISTNKFNRIPGPPSNAVLAMGVAPPPMPDPLFTAGLMLRPDSPYKGKGTDGKDPGADIPAVIRATCGVISGNWDCATE